MREILMTESYTVLKITCIISLLALLSYSVTSYRVCYRKPLSAMKMCDGFLLLLYFEFLLFDWVNYGIVFFSSITSDGKYICHQTHLVLAVEGGILTESWRLAGRKGV